MSFDVTQTCALDIEQGFESTRGHEPEFSTLLHGVDFDPRTRHSFPMIQMLCSNYAQFLPGVFLGTMSG